MPNTCVSCAPVVGRALAYLTRVYCVLREERNLDVAAIAEGGESAVRMGPPEGLLEIVERFLAVLAPYLLQRHNVWVQPLDRIGKQLEFALVSLFDFLRSTRKGAHVTLFGRRSEPPRRLDKDGLLIEASYGRCARSLFARRPYSPSAPTLVCPPVRLLSLFLGDGGDEFAAEVGDVGNHRGSVGPL
jgi:hypothetical protein